MAKRARDLPCAKSVFKPYNVRRLESIGNSDDYLTTAMEWVIAGVFIAFLDWFGYNLSKLL